MPDKVSHTAGSPSAGFVVYGLGGYSFGAVITALTVGKVGSDINYFLELMAICSIWSAIGINHFINQKIAIQRIFFAFLSLQLIWASIAGVVLSHSVIGPRWDDLPLYNAMYTQVKNATQKGIVLSDDYLDMVVLSGQSVYYQPFEYGQLYQAGLWDPKRFVSDINQHLFPLILIGGETIDKPCCWPPPIGNAIQQNYTFARNKFGLVLTLK